jgi:hypothetical protein
MTPPPPPPLPTSDSPPPPPNVVVIQVGPQYSPLRPVPPSEDPGFRVARRDARMTAMTPRAAAKAKAEEPQRKKEQAERRAALREQAKALRGKGTLRPSGGPPPAGDGDGKMAVYCPITGAKLAGVSKSLFMFFLHLKFTS